MPDSNSSTRVFFRMPNELAEALDALIPELREETFGEVHDRSKAARYLLIEAIERRQRENERRELIDDALETVEAKRKASSASAT